MLFLGENFSLIWSNSVAALVEVEMETVTFPEKSHVKGRFF